MRKSHLTTDCDERYHKIVFGVVTKLTKKSGEITSKDKLYKFKMEAVQGKISKDMLVEVLLSQNDFVNRVEGVH